MGEASSPPVTQLLQAWSAGDEEALARLKSQLLYRERLKDGTLDKPVVFLRTAFNERAPRFSPDGRFVAYVSDESGTNEIYVRDFPNGGGQWQVSVKGGVAPRWRRDGGEIYYLEPGAGLMAVSVTTRPTVSPGTPKLLFGKRVLGAGYDVSADGKRFIILDRPSDERRCRSTWYTIGSRISTGSRRTRAGESNSVWTVPELRVEPESAIRGGLPTAPSPAA